MLILVIEGIIGAVAAIVIYNVLHYLFVTRPTRHNQLLVKKRVDSEISKVINEMQTSNSLHDKVFNDYLGSNVLSNVWGRGVMVFEYKVVVDSEFTDDEAGIENILTATLNKYANQDHFNNQKGNTLLITDSWLHGNHFIFDIAYVINPATREYLADISKLEEK